MQRYKILWVDDEIDLLKPYVIFLEQKQYEVITFNNPFLILEYLETNKDSNLILIDENMPGKSGISLISDIKSITNSIPIIMITKNEEEDIMNDAIGSDINDYLIKPLNPNQLLISIKKVLENNSIVKNKLKIKYTDFFMELSDMINNNNSHKDWTDIYKKIIDWEISLDKTDDDQINQMVITQKKEANRRFSDFIKNNYSSWVQNKDGPIMSNNLLKEKIFPHIDEDKIFFILLDNFRYDHWKVLEEHISNYFYVTSEESFYSIIPTTTEYSRNSIFSGLSPHDMKLKEFDLWSDKSSGFNNNEYLFLDNNFKRNGYEIDHSYNKIISYEDGEKFIKNINQLDNYKFSSVVFNFIDMLSHAKNDSKILKNLVYDEKSFRSFILSWFKNSSFNELLKILSSKNVKVFITTDHGTIKVDEPVMVKAQKEANNNMRFKYGKNINIDNDIVFTCENGEDIMLPKENIFTKYIFACNNQFLLYPNNYNFHQKKFRNTFQHGGISMEEMIVPFIQLSPKL